MKLNPRIPITLLAVGVSALSQAVPLDVDYGFTGLASYTGPKLIEATTITLDPGTITDPQVFFPRPAPGNVTNISPATSFTFPVATIPSQLVGLTFDTPLANGDTVVFTTTGLKAVSTYQIGDLSQFSFFLTGGLSDTFNAYSPTQAIAVFGVTQAGTSVSYSANVANIAGTPSPAAVLPMAVGLISVAARKRRRR